MEAGRNAAGSSRALRLDPFTLPVQFPARDAGADGQIRQVELDRERVVLRRAVRGIRMAVGVPIRDFRGVALRLSRAGETSAPTFAIELDHRDAALSVLLFAATTGEEIVPIWKAWSRVLDLPLLVAESDNTVRELLPLLGAVTRGEPVPRRRRRSPLKRRRPSILLRRRPGRQPEREVIYREREIIARN